LRAKRRGETTVREKFPGGRKKLGLGKPRWPGNQTGKTSSSKEAGLKSAKAWRNIGAGGTRSKGGGGWGPTRKRKKLGVDLGTVGRPWAKVKPEKLIKITQGTKRRARPTVAIKGTGRTNQWRNWAGWSNGGSK